MAALLYRLGRFSARRRWLVLSVWAVLLAVVATLAIGLKTTATAETGFSIPGTEASQGLDVVQEKFSTGDSDNATATVVFQTQDGAAFEGGNEQAVEGLLSDLRSIDGIASVSDPLSTQTPRVSSDGSIAAATVTFDSPAADVSEETTDAFDDATGADLSADGTTVRVEVTSDLLETGGHSAEAVGIVVAFVVLVLTYGSLAAAGANLLTAAVGVGVGYLGIAALTKVVSLSTTTPALATMLGLAVGIDYALFIFARTRSELRAGAGVQQAVAKATGTAGTAVVFAGTTVVIALAGLAVVNIPFLTEMGLAAAATVAVAVLVALTAVPALLAVLGRRVLPKKERNLDLTGLRAASELDEAERTTVPDATLAGPGLLGRWSRAVTRRPVITLVAAVLAVGAVAAPVLSMRTALPSAENSDPASSSRQAYDLLVDAFGPGSQATLVVLVDGTDPARVSTAATGVVSTIQGLDDVAAVTAPVASADGTAQLITVVPNSGPTDDATTDLVHDLRDAVSGTSGADVLVTGQTALNIDVNQALNEALPVYIAVIVVLALALLVLLFRSIAVPLLATVGFLLSLGASLGSVVAIYQWGWLSDVFGVAQPGPLLSFMPVLVVGILFGLAMDYQMFLVSAIHEAHAKGQSPTRAILAGFRRSAPVVVSASLIMAGVFAGFAFSGDAIIGTIGMALTVGVLVDALVVRMVIVPAALTLLGEAAWWMPRWMQRIVPNVDAEGHGLDALLAAPATPSETPSPVSLPAPRAHDGGGSSLSGPAVHGHVRDEDDHPLTTAVVTVTDPAGREIARTATDVNGAYRVSVPVGGTFVLIVAAAGATPVAEMVAVAGVPVHRDLRLAGTASLSGRITATPEDGGAAVAIADTVLTLLDAQGDVVATARSGADGAYGFTGLRAGTYVLSALDDVHRPQAVTVEIAHADQVTHHLRLRRGARLQGSVTAASDGRAVREALVNLVDAEGAVVHTTSTDQHGHFLIDSLDAGTYTLTASGYAPVAATVRVEDGVSHATELTLGLDPAPVGTTSPRPALEGADATS